MWCANVAKMNIYLLQLFSKFSYRITLEADFFACNVHLLATLIGTPSLRVAERKMARFVSV